MPTPSIQDYLGNATARLLPRYRRVHDHPGSEAPQLRHVLVAAHIGSDRTDGGVVLAGVVTAEQQLATGGEAGAGRGAGATAIATVSGGERLG
jgi:hypothetical protein